MKDLAISVITVTYNSEKFIANLLNSLLKNLPSGSEIIIVDNNSTDRTVPASLSQLAASRVLRYVVSSSDAACCPHFADPKAIRITWN